MDRLNNFTMLLGFIQKHKSIIRDFHKKWRCKQGCQSRWFCVTSAVSEDVAGKYVEMFVQQGRTVNITHGIVTSWCTWEQIFLFFITLGSLSFLFPALHLEFCLLVKICYTFCFHKYCFYLSSQSKR